jgi:hypothetical protein
LFVGFALRFLRLLLFNSSCEMKTLAAIIPGKTERMGRWWLRKMLLGRIIACGTGVGWEIHPSHADMLLFGENSETRERWIDDAYSEHFSARSEEYPDLDPALVKEVVAARRHICSLLVSDVLHLIDAPLDDRKSATGEFLFQIKEVVIPVTVAYTLEGDVERLELRFRATPEQRESARRAEICRRENPNHTAPVAPDEHLSAPADRRSRAARWVDGFMWILIAVFTTITAFVFPLSTLFAFAWGFTVIPFCIWQYSHSRFVIGKMSQRAELILIVLGFFALLFCPAVICGIILRTFEAIAVFVPTLAGLFAFGLVVFLWQRRHPQPALESL